MYWTHSKLICWRPCNLGKARTSLRCRGLLAMKSSLKLVHRLALSPTSLHHLGLWSGFCTLVFICCTHRHTRRAFLRSVYGRKQKILFKSSGGISKVIFTLFSSWLHLTKWLSMTAYPLSALFPRCLTVSGRFTKHHTHLSLFLVQTRAFLPPCENPELQASAQLTDEQSPPSALRLKYKAARLSNKAISLSLHDLSPLCCQIELQSI